MPLLLMLLVALTLVPASARAGVEFTDCQPAAGGGITCDTQPTGNTA
ncbi:MAG: hypothetical protein RLZZ346_181, partial [Cyanobacteriota bacterium]